MSERVSSALRGSERLAARRRLHRRRVNLAFGIFILALIVLSLWGLQQSAVRISHVQVSGADESFATYALQAMRGSYFGIIPRDSIFFFPEARIRSELLAAHPEVAAVSIFLDGLTGLSIKVDKRVPVALWCGLAPTEGADEYCYLFDAKGYIFAAAATTTETVNSFSVYAHVAEETLEPLGATLVNAEKLPSAFDFARQLSTLGSPVGKVIFRGDEVDDYLESGTRITYVLGDEQNAFTALISSRTDYDLANGSIEYIDLRFSGKMYLKKKSDTVQ
jgi:hypothetical protein